MRETAAAILIQRRFRGYFVRSLVREKGQHAIDIQRVWRGCMGRKLAVDRRAAFRTAGLHARKAAVATAFQSLVRGHLSRKTKHDFHARKRYLTQLMGEHAALRQKLLEAEERQRRDREQAATEHESGELRRLFSSIHHLVSTRAIPGVLAGKGTTIGDTVLVAARGGEGVDYEGRVRAAAREGSEKGRFKRTRGATESQLLPRSGSHGTVPSYTEPTSVTLRCGAPYDTVHKAESSQRRVSKLAQLTTVPFIAGAKKQVIGKPLAGTGVHASVPYVSPVVRRFTSRDVQDSALNKTRRMGPSPFHRTLSRVSGVFEEAERAKRVHTS